MGSGPPRTTFGPFACRTRQGEVRAVHHHTSPEPDDNRRVDPLRQRTPVFGEKRRKLEQAHDDYEERIAALDRELDDLCQRRRELVAKRRLVRRQLFVNLAKRGRRALDDGTEALPPIDHQPRWLYGRRLRAMCLRILARRGPLTLVELHAQLHRLGCAIGHRHPVKALADALAYETELGRARRVSRGVYELVAGTRLPEVA